MPAMAAVKITLASVVAAATPTSSAAIETMPSFAPRTPARNQFRRDEMSASSGPLNRSALCVDLAMGKD